MVREQATWLPLSRVFYRMGVNIENPVLPVEFSLMSANKGAQRGPSSENLNDQVDTEENRHSSDIQALARL